MAGRCARLRALLRLLPALAVTVAFSGADSVSGIASCSGAVSFPSRGIDLSAVGTCTNSAGLVSLSATASNIDIDIDVTSLTVSIAAPTNGALQRLVRRHGQGCRRTSEESHLRAQRAVILQAVGVGLRALGLWAGSRPLCAAV
jgi:hypothetical protein